MDKKAERLAWQRKQRKLNGNKHTKKYEKTRKGFLMRKYRNMQSRVAGIQKKKQHLYKDKVLLDRDDFYEWAINSPCFEQLWTDWIASGYERKLCPTVDRINSSEGYMVSNMHWMTHSENSRRGCFSRYGIDSC